MGRNASGEIGGSLPLDGVGGTLLSAPDDDGVTRGIAGSKGNANPGPLERAGGTRSSDSSVAQKEARSWKRSAGRSDRALANAPSIASETRRPSERGEGRRTVSAVGADDTSPNKGSSDIASSNTLAKLLTS